MLNALIAAHFLHVLSFDSFAFQEADVVLNTDEQSIDFGDDSSVFSNDGECDDPRFEGPGMTATRLLDSDIRADATDCRTAFEAGRITLRDNASGGSATTGAPTEGDPDDIDFGDNSSDFANDGECDDPRFTGPGVAFGANRTNLMRDANDCRSALEAGNALYEGEMAPLFSGSADGVDYGDNTSDFADDGECDDPRFAGENVAAGANRANSGHDAHDCYNAVQNGQAEFQSEMAPLFTGSADGVNYGDNSSEYADDGECDDPRFSGAGVAPGARRDNAGRDAHDCHNAVASGAAEFTGDLDPLFSGTFRGVDFGDNSGDYVEDGECDDPRFRGPGMAVAPLSQANRGADAADCQWHFQYGFVELAVSDEPFTGRHDGIDFGDNSSDYALDAECDDPRFIGPAVARNMEGAVAGRDASDCKIAYERGELILKPADD